MQIISKHDPNRRWRIGPFIIGPGFRVPVGNAQPSKGKVEFRESKVKFVDGPWYLRIGYGTADEFRASNLDHSRRYWFISFRPPWHVYKSDNCPYHDPAHKKMNDEVGSDFNKEYENFVCEECGADLTVRL